MTKSEHSSSLRLSPVDQASFPVYVRLLYIFPFPDTSQRPHAERHVRERLEACLTRWPWLGGHVVGVDNAASPAIEVRYRDPTPSSSPLDVPNRRDGDGCEEEEILVVKELGLREGWVGSYEELAARRWFGEGLLDKDVLSNRPEHPELGERRRWPALGLQVNWVDGGLVLCFAFHHQVVDGCGITRFLEEFAGDGREEVLKGVDSADGARGAIVFRLPLFVKDRAPPEEYCFDYRTHVPLPDSEAPVKRGKNVTRILRFDASGLRRLKGEVNAELKKRCPDLWVSTMDCLCAVIWIGLTRARWHRGREAGKAGAGEALKPHETTRFNIAVNARRRLQPPLPDTYMGNAFVVSVAQASVEDVIGTAISRVHPLPTPPASPMQPAAERRACPPTTQTIATAALRIRQAINSVDDAYIRRRFNFAASLCAKQTPAHVSPGDCGAALHRALDPARAGVDCSSWIDFPVTDFRIPGTTTMTTDGGQDGGEGRPAWVRKTYSANPGAVNVLPRRGGTKGSDEDEWEVLVAAAEVDVERMVEGMEECRGFVGVV